MPYTRITSSKNGAEAIRYARDGAGHDGSEKRNQYMTGVNMMPDEVVPFEKQMGVYWNKKSSRNKTEAFRLIQSFGVDELNPDQPEDVLLAHRIGCETAKALWPDYQVAVFTQTDGKGHKIHNHLIVCNVNTKTYKGLTGAQTKHDLYVKPKSDEICKKYIEVEPPEPVTEKVTQAERTKREKNEKLIAEGKDPEYIWKDDLKDRIRKAKEASFDMDSFSKQLTLNGVEMDLRRPTEKHPDGYIVYELTDVTRFSDKVPKNLKSKSFKLGTDFDVVGLRDYFDHKESVAESEKDTPEEVSSETKQVSNTVSVDIPKDPMKDAQTEAFRYCYEIMREADTEVDRDAAIDSFVEFTKVWRPEQAKAGNKLPTIYQKDKETGIITVNRDALGMQYRGFLNWKNQRQNESDEDRQKRRLALLRETLGDIAERAMGENYQLG